MLSPFRSLKWRRNSRWPPGARASAAPGTDPPGRASGNGFPVCLVRKNPARPGKAAVLPAAGGHAPSAESKAPRNRARSLPNKASRRTRRRRAAAARGVAAGAPETAARARVASRATGRVASRVAGKAGNRGTVGPRDSNNSSKGSRAKGVSATATGATGSVPPRAETGIPPTTGKSSTHGRISH